MTDVRVMYIYPHDLLTYNMFFIDFNCFLFRSVVSYKEIPIGLLRFGQKYASLVSRSVGDMRLLEMGLLINYP